MQVFGGGTPGPARQCYPLSAADILPLLHIVLCIVGIEGLRTIGMAYDDALAVAGETARQGDDTVEGGIDGVAGLGLEIDSRMAMRAPIVAIGTDYLGTWQRVAAVSRTVGQILRRTARTEEDDGKKQEEQWSERVLVHRRHHLAFGSWRRAAVRIRPEWMPSRRAEK